MLFANRPKLIIAGANLVQNIFLFFLHTYIHAYTHTFTRTHTFTCTHAYIHAYTRTHIHAYTHIHSREHTLSRTPSDTHRSSIFPPTSSTIVSAYCVLSVVRTIDGEERRGVHPTSGFVVLPVEQIRVICSLSSTRASWVVSFILAGHMAAYWLANGPG